MGSFLGQVKTIYTVLLGREDHVSSAREFSELAYLDNSKNVLSSILRFFISMYKK